MSHPKRDSVNDAIDLQLCAVSYASFDRAIFWVRKFGNGALIAKVDIEAAFCLLPLHPNSFSLLGYYWLGQFFVDLCLPMGCAISCAFSLNLFGVSCEGGLGIEFGPKLS